LPSELQVFRPTQPTGSSQLTSSPGLQASVAWLVDVDEQATAARAASTRTPATVDRSRRISQRILGDYFSDVIGFGVARSALP